MIASPKIHPTMSVTASVHHTSAAAKVPPRSSSILPVILVPPEVSAVKPARNQDQAAKNATEASRRRSTAASIADGPAGGRDEIPPPRSLWPMRPRGAVSSILGSAVAPILASLLACASQTASSPASRTPIVARYDGPIIDVHAHLRTGADDGLAPSQPEGTAALRALEQAAGVTRAGLIVIARAGAIEDTRRRNDAVLAAARDSGGFFFAIASVHPADGEASLAELDRVAAARCRRAARGLPRQRGGAAAPGLNATWRGHAATNTHALSDGTSPPLQFPSASSKPAGGVHCLSASRLIATYTTSSPDSTR